LALYVGRAAAPAEGLGYGLNQLRYDLRKLKGHGLIERDGNAITRRMPFWELPIPALADRGDVIILGLVRRGGLLPASVCWSAVY
jgi:hypothetical protein